MAGVPVQGGADPRRLGRVAGPVGAVRRRALRADERRLGRHHAGSDDAWVAVYCGYEIQLYDGTDGETRKTGSIYTFDNNDIDEIGPAKPVGEWEDYEIEVRGMHFKISRNGQVIKEFDNTPGK